MHFSRIECWSNEKKLVFIAYWLCPGANRANIFQELLFMGGKESLKMVIAAATRILGFEAHFLFNSILSEA